MSRTASAWPAVIPIRLNEQGLSVPKELGTRVNTSALKAPDAKVQAVQFFPNPKLKKPSE